MSAKTCLITGASRGIGLATARRFARQGYQIAAVARNRADLQAAADEVAALNTTCLPLAADVGVAAEARRVVQATIERFGRIDVLVNNAGRAPRAVITDFDPVEFEQTIAVNVAAVFHASQAAWPAMKTQHAGVIVNLSSRASVDPFPGFAVYGATKAWVNVFTLALATEGKPHGIRVFAVAPGAVETQMLRGAFPDFPPDRTLDPDDVAAVIESVCDERMASASGQTVFVQR